MMRITITDPDPIVYKDAKHAVRFTRELGEHGSETTVVHLTDEELRMLTQASIGRILAEARLRERERQES